MKKISEYDKTIDALNLIDEQAERGDNSYEEEKHRQVAYDIVADFIDKYANR
jgi:hypothetical protein